MIYLSLAVQAQALPSKQNDVATNQVTGSLILLLPIITLLTITGYRKYKARSLNRQVAYLERMWRLTSPKKTP
ncbi:hypothetical protein NIES22_42870 [Calothrix brevissima NIES-22]|nr:hypothetical protein NIES22_42870 [Calothrix brevissima NIES-22]